MTQAAVRTPSPSTVAPERLVPVEVPAASVPGRAVVPVRSWGAPGTAQGAPPASGRRRRVAEVAAGAASVLGLASAALSLGWAVGGTLLLDALLPGTVVGTLLSGTVVGRAVPTVVTGTPVALAVAVVVVAVTVLAALLPGWALSPDAPGDYPSARRRVVRALAWGEAAVLTGLGAALTGRAVLGLAGAPAVAGADTGALAWQAVLWGPWLLLWGLAALVAVVASHRRSLTANSAGRSVRTS